MNGLERIHASNPLLKPLGNYINLAEWPQTLGFDPLEGVDRSRLNEMERDLLLAQIVHRVEPTDYTTKIASTLQTMLWRHSVDGNPEIAENRLRTMQVLGERGRTLASAAWMPTFASAFMIVGCTGTGKSTAVEEYLKLLKPYFDHSAELAAEWNKHLQITFLVVPMPVHRGGLLYAILAAIDSTIGTSYRTKYSDRRIWTIEKLAIEVGILLVQHSVGLLVIEEIQARNFAASPNREEMLLFILRILNFGIPVVLVGNPLGFIGLEDFSQDINRLTEREPIHLTPADASDLDWKDGIGPGMWGHNVMLRETPWDSAVSAELFACSASFPGYTARAVEGVQRMAMSESGCEAVTMTHLKRYRDESETFKRNRNLIDGFRLKDPLKLMRYLDVPWEEYGLKWGKISLEDILVADGGHEETVATDMSEEDKAAYRSVHDRIRRSAAAQTTRKTNKVKSGRKTKSGAGPDDLRSGSTALLTAGLDALRRRLAAEKT